MHTGRSRLMLVLSLVLLASGHHLARAPSLVAASDGALEGECELRQPGQTSD